MDQKPKFENAYALLIGTASEKEIQATATDAEGISSALQSNANYSYKQIKVLVENNAVKGKVEEAFKSLTPHVENGPDNESTVVIYFSGHGKPPNDLCDEFHMLLYGSDASVKDKTDIPSESITNTEREEYLANVITATELKKHLKEIIAKKWVFFLNCCHAGGVAAKAFSMGKSAKQNSALVEKNVNKDLLRELDTGEGAVFISACAWDEESIIPKNGDHTLFGDKLIEALKGAGSPNSEIVYLADVVTYLDEEVPREANKYGIGTQTPYKSVRQKTKFPIAFHRLETGVSQRNKYYIQSLPPEQDPVPTTTLKVSIRSPTKNLPDKNEQPDKNENIYLKKAGSLSLQYNMRTHDDLIKDIKSELACHLFQSLPVEVQQEIKSELQKDVPGKLLLDCGQGKDSKFTYPWELITIPIGHVANGTGKRIKVADFCSIARQVHTDGGVQRDKRSEFRVLLIDGSEQQEFFHFFKEKYDTNPEFTKIFTVLGNDDDMIDLAKYDTVTSTVQNIKPFIIHYVGNISQAGKQAKLTFLDQANTDIPKLNDDNIRDGTYKWLFEGGAFKRTPIPGIFIVQEWGKEDCSTACDIKDFERAALFFSKCGIPLSCFVPYCKKIKSEDYIDSIYKFEETMELDDLFKSESFHQQVRFSLFENLRKFVKKFGDECQFSPLIYQNVETPYGYNIIREEESSSLDKSKSDFSPKIRAESVTRSGKYETNESVQNDSMSNGSAESKPIKRKDNEQGRNPQEIRPK